MFSQHDSLSIFIQLFHEAFHTPPSFTSWLNSNLTQLLLDFIIYLKAPSHDDMVLRYQHMNRFRSLLSSAMESPTTTSQHKPLHSFDEVPLSNPPSLSSTTCEDEEDHEIHSIGTTLFASTYTLQHLRLTNKITTKPKDEDETTRTTSALANKINHLLRQLELVIPTRSSSFSALSDSHYWEDDHSPLHLPPFHHFNKDHPSQQQPWVRILHPLQATEEDYASYKRGLHHLLTAFYALPTDDLWRVQKLYGTLKLEVEHAETCFAQFKRGFALARLCSSTRRTLDTIQHRMATITTHEEIDALDSDMNKVNQAFETLESTFEDLLVDPVYEQHVRCLKEKTTLVQTWMDEVRVWFAEAARIRQWMDEHMEELDSIVPSSCQGEIEALEAKVEVFDKEDMARLRSHVKVLTGPHRQQELSPADTTTIEITLTTLTALDKLIHALRKKQRDVQIVRRRVAWETAYEASMVWLKETHAQVNAFVESSRWMPPEQDESERRSRNRHMAKEKQKESMIQQLIAFEEGMTAFDAGQFTTTVEFFLDIEEDNGAEEFLHGVEARQSEMEQYFEDLTKRIAFARKLVEQRLSLMDFLHQTDLVMEDALVLQMDLVESKNSHDREDLTARVQKMRGAISQLVSMAHRIPYPDILEKNNSNKEANDAILRVVTTRRNELIVLIDDLEERLYRLRNRFQIQKRAQEYIDEADRLIDWADDRIKMIRRAKNNVQDDIYTAADDLQRLQREYKSMVNTLKHGKENEAIDLLTRIQLLLDTTQKLRMTSVNRNKIQDAANHLQERFDRLQQILDDYELVLQAFDQRCKDGQKYMEGAQRLQAYVHEKRHALLPSLKQKCGFMTGQSQSQDQAKLELLSQALEDLKEENKIQQLRYDQLYKQFRLMAPTVDNLEKIHVTQKELELEWKQLQQDTHDFEAFTSIVCQWYARQQQLSMVEREIAEIDVDVIEVSEKKVQHIMDLLDEMAKEIGVSFNSQDPLQIANYSCARNRQLALLQKMKTIMAHLETRRSNATQTTAVSNFLKKIADWCSQVDAEKQTIRSRMDGLDGFELTSLTSMDEIFKRVQKANAVSERTCRMLKQTCSTQLMNEAQELGSSDNDVSHTIAEAKLKINELVDTILLEKKQAVILRRVYVHAKAAHDLQSWIDQCSRAVTELWVEDKSNAIRNELNRIELKILEMKPTMQAFQDMKSRIFATPEALEEICLNVDQVNQVVQEREAFILKRWKDLQIQYESMQKWSSKSKQGQEVMKKIKHVLAHIETMKDRVNAVHIDHTGWLLKNRDLDTVLRDPSILSLPTENCLATAKAALDILDCDIEAELNPLVQALDNLLKERKYHEYGKDISASLDDLKELMMSKKKSITEAEKMEGFLTVVEELEVLLLALKDVITRGSPEYAQKADKEYTQSDLQAIYMDLDTRCQYYEPKIKALFDEAKEVLENMKENFHVVDCLHHLNNKWQQLQRESGVHKAKLLELIESQRSSSSLPDAGEGILKEMAKKVADIKPTAAVEPPPTPKPMSLTPRVMKATTTPVPFALSATAARAQARRSIGGTISPVERRVNARQAAAQQQRLRVTTMRSPIPETYIADPKNDLDVALGDIVNDCPYKIKVKMVPGEVGKYWFGHVNPKLAYCRILRSRMVMVRVGGGWVELSQFLRDHALLEDDVTPGSKPSRASLSPPPRSIVEDGYLSVGGKEDDPRQSKVRSGHGIKSGNKFLVDVGGNQVEVKMTKARSKTTKFITPRRHL